MAKKIIDRRKTAPFNDPVIRAKAHAAAKGVKRPNRKSRQQLINEAKVEVVKEELIREGYLKEVRKHMPKIMKAHFKVAGMAKVGATQERKLFFEASGLKKDDGVGAAESMGQIIADLMKS